MYISKHWCNWSAGDSWQIVSGWGVGGGAVHHDNDDNNDDKNDDDEGMVIQTGRPAFKRRGLKNEYPHSVAAAGGDGCHGCYGWAFSDSLMQ